MTKQRDRYQSGFDEAAPGIRSAVYDIGLALYCLKRVAEQQELLRERFTFNDGESWTVAQILEIASDALNQSVEPVARVYERLRQNEEAAQVMADGFPSDADWHEMAFALQRTLSNKAIVSRGEVTRARKQIERCARESKETGGDA